MNLIYCIYWHNSLNGKVHTSLFFYVEVNNKIELVYF
jgi:hypothetical protein